MEDKKKTKINLKIILAIILVVAIAIVIYIMNRPKEIADIKYDIKITYRYSSINMPLTGYASDTEYVLVNIDEQKAYFINDRYIFVGEEKRTLLYTC